MLDVGCGAGILTRELLPLAEHVTAIDLDPASVALAREATAAGEIEYLAGDFLTHPFAPGSFDAIVSVAALHHMDAGAALARMRRLLSPGGTLAVVGLARGRMPLDLAAAVVNLAYTARKGY